MTTWTMWHHRLATYGRGRPFRDEIEPRAWVAGLRLGLRILVTLAVLGAIGVGIGLGTGWALSSAVHLLLGTS